MNYIYEIQKLVEHIEKHKNFQIINSNNCFYNHHLGAVLTDIILQAGLNYKNTVLPRVLDVYNKYPTANNLQGLINVINHIGISNFLNWKNDIKINRFNEFLNFLDRNNIQSTLDLTFFLQNSDNVNDLLALNGIGNKTVDYFLKLMHVETIAVDRHIIKFLTEANISYSNYQSAKKIVEYTADILNISRRDIDYSIWSYMSENKRQKVLELNF